MRSCVLLSTLALIALASQPRAAEPDSLIGCVSETEAAQRRDCHTEWVRTGLIDAGRFGALRYVVENHPAEGLEVLGLIERGANRPMLEAALLDLEGQARFALEHYDEAASAFERAVDLNDGATRVRWVAPGGGWSAAVDIGNGRLLRGARSLLAAGRTSEARDWLARGLALGAAAGPESGWQSLGTAVSELAPATAPLVGLEWFRPLPDLQIELTEGGPFSIAEARGRVLVLNFWATWCQPCIKELGHLQYFYETERENGLEIVAVNAQEPVQLVVPYVKELGLTMPIGRYDSALDGEFEVRTLPTMVVADRLGRMRGRWVGYEEGQERDVIKVVEALLVNDPPTREVATILGSATMELLWARDVGAAVEGFTVEATADGPRLFVTHGPFLGVFRPDGAIDRRIDGTRIAGRVRAASPDADGMQALFAFHRGADRVVRFDLPAGTFEAWEAPAPVFDLVPLRNAAGDSLLLATQDGLYRTGFDGSGARRVDGFGLVTALATESDGGSTVVLEAGRRLSWLDVGLDIVDRREVDGTSWSLVLPRNSGMGVGTLPSSVVAAASGRFFADDTLQVAVGSTGGQLVVVDVETGRLRFRAGWPGIRDLRAADLDGDGRDELVLAAGRDLAVLTAVD